MLIAAPGTGAVFEIKSGYHVLIQHRPVQDLYDSETAIFLQNGDTVMLNYSDLNV